MDSNAMTRARLVATAPHDYPLATLQAALVELILAEPGTVDDLIMAVDEAIEDRKRRDSLTIKDVQF